MEFRWMPRARSSSSSSSQLPASNSTATSAGSTGQGSWEEGTFHGWVNAEPHTRLAQRHPPTKEGHSSEQPQKPKTSQSP
ncbi:hypothetical protein HYQ46_008456 [Verticillium longisporum]|nr:hypothetical protein HYQ46_008456 [Verticillium longisporum]